jgi:hypothetical protein
LRADVGETLDFNGRMRASAPFWDGVFTAAGEGRTGLAEALWAWRFA